MKGPGLVAGPLPFHPNGGIRETAWFFTPNHPGYMTRATSIEIWEAVTQATSWVTTVNDRGVELSKAVGGPGNPPRIRIKTADRHITEEANPDNNPFNNGMLRRVDGQHVENRAQVGKTNDQLLGLLQLGDSFEDRLMEEDELIVRRLYLLVRDPEYAERFSVAQATVIRRVVDARWPQQDPPSEQLAAAEDLFR